MVLSIFITIIILGVVAWFCYYNYKKCEDNLEKSLYILLFCVSITPIIIYYLDRYNIPTLLGWSINLNSQNWLSFMANYSSSVISAIISAVVLVIVTILQINKNNEDNMKRDKENNEYNVNRDKENMRLQNMPILKYTFNSETIENNDLEELIVTNIEEGRPYTFNIYLKNIGLNNIKNLKVDFTSDLINNSTERLLGKKSIEVMEKGEEKIIRKFFSLKQSDIPYEITINVYYQDVLSNWYKQEVEVKYTATNIFKPGGYIGNIDYQVKEEKQINIEEIKKVI